MKKNKAIKRHKKKRNKKKQKGMINMATISFDRKITLNEVSAKALINKIEHDKKNPAVLQNIDIEQRLNEGKKLLRQLFSH